MTRRRRLGVTIAETARRRRRHLVDLGSGHDRFWSGFGRERHVLAVGGAEIVFGDDPVVVGRVAVVGRDLARDRRRAGRRPGLDRVLAAEQAVAARGPVFEVVLRVVAVAGEFCVQRDRVLADVGGGFGRQTGDRGRRLE